MARTKDQRGAVTAETAVALPLLIVVAVGLAWLVALGVTQVKVVDAARETARAVARGDGPDVAVALGEQIAPDGARIRVSTGNGQVVVEVSAQVRGPGGILAFVPGFAAHARAVAAQEPGS
ncbi:MAG: hypothetical protein JWQ74_51 [Marmoricola sp.]|nr:hypothetical protein [Marmoricola sp.]